MCRVSLQVLLTGYALFRGCVVPIPGLVLVPVFLSPLAVVVTVGGIWDMNPYKHITMTWRRVESEGRDKKEDRRF